MRRLAALVLTAALVAGAFIAGPSPAGAASGSSGTYQAVTPTRLLDTRTSQGGGPLAARSTRALTVTGGVIPASASAVVLTVTVTAPTAGGFLTVYPAGAARPGTSTLNFVARRTVPNLAVVRVGTGGQIRIYNGSAGRSDVLVDVAGYYTGSSAPAGQGAFGTLPAPRRVLDTRTGAAVAGHSARSFTVTGSGVPAGASAVVLNLAATQEATTGWATAYAAGGARPFASNLNFVRGTTVANLAVVPVGADGKVTLFNGSTGSAHFFADISGFFLAGDPVVAGALGSLTPARVLDTRRSGVPVGAGRSITVSLKGRAGVPLAGVRAAVLNVTATQGTRGGHLTVYGSGSRPNVSNVNYLAGQTVPDLVVAPVSGTGTVTIYNGSPGSVHVFADISGYVLGTDLAVPVVSTSRYVRNISDGGATDVQTMHDEGCTDANSGSTLVLLDIGAQLNDKTGVALTVIDRRVKYSALVDAVNGYLAGFAACGTGATIALGTNNGGDFSAYTAAARGKDWADKVVDAVTVPAGLTVAGANDIEAGFASTEVQAEQWESAFLANTAKNLIFNGSADGCPTAYGATGTCNYGWTQANHYKLAGGLNPTRITALPQIYVPEQAVQWANIQRIGGKQIKFEGALTEAATCPTASSPGCTLAALPPERGWAALYHALSTLITAPALPVVTDLRVDS